MLRQFSLGCLIALAAACSPQTAGVERAPSPPPPAPAADLTPALPPAPGPQRPTFAEHSQGAPDVNLLNGVEGCAYCHSDIVAEWRQSPHALSAFANPWYRLSLEDFTQARGAENARFCNGCHDVAVAFNPTAAPVAPDQVEGFAGVTCATCHGITQADPLGNGSYHLTTAPVPVPTGDDLALLDAHRRRVASTALRTDALCISCHRGVLTADIDHETPLGGIDEYGPWRRSAYAGSLASQIDAPLQPQGCASCHMPPVPASDGLRQRPLHRFPGGHASMAAAIDAPAQLDAIRDITRDTIWLDLRAMQGQPGRATPLEDTAAPPPAGQHLLIDLVIHNQGVGHDFPGGVKDLKDTWVELTLRDRRGELLLASGVDHEHSGHEPDVHRLRALLLDKQGRAVTEHRVADFRAKVFDRTIAPRDVAIARYELSLPGELAQDQWPLQLHARLRQRRLPLDLHRRACDESKTPRGAAFRDATRAHKGLDLDPCRPQPILDLATANLALGPGADDDEATRPTWERLLRHGQGLSRHLQENLEEANTLLTLAADALPNDAPTWGRAAIALELGRVAGRQGRTDDAQRHLDLAATLMPDHPAVALARAQSFEAVWRWEPAADAFREVTRLAPQDDRGWRGLSQALGSLGRREEALDAARRGLALEPRDPDLLRHQGLALRDLAPNDPRADDAHEAWLAWRADDIAPGIRARCDDPASRCQRERIPIPVRPLLPPR
jgi:tetratricopeptide (TPR) repeat protein